MKKKLLFAKINPNSNVIIPSRRDEDGCYDIYAYFDEPYIEIAPGEIKMISTGLASAFSPNYRICVRERGSSGTMGLSCRSGQIDSGYRGEWFIAINNTTNKLIVIAKEEYVNKNPFLQNSKHITLYPYEKAICQVALELVPDVNVEEIPYEDLKNIHSDRGYGKLGSSNK